MSDTSYDEAKKEVERLVAKLRQFQEADQIKRLSEEETKKNFITPLFRALGWDVEISELNRKIDEQVYDLYGLSAEERRIVEEAVK